MKQSELHIQSKSLPELPGVYQFYDDEKIIYIGKAKNLKKEYHHISLKTMTVKKQGSLLKA